MRFKSLNFCAKAIGFSFFATLQAAHALTVTPVSPYFFNDSTLWVASSGIPATDGFIDAAAGYNDFDLTLRASTDLSSTREEMIVLDVTTTQTFDTSSGILVVSLFVKKDDDEFLLAPIAAAKSFAYGTSRTDGVPDACVQGTNCTGQTTVGSETLYTGAITAKNSILRIGFYPKDVCAMVEQSDGIDECTGDTVVAPTATTTRSINFRVSVQVIASATSTPVISSSVTDDHSDFKLTMTLGVPKFASTCTIADVYFPGDSEIAVSMAGLRTEKSSGSAPIAAVLFLADSSALDLTPAGYSSNDIVARLPPDSSLRGVSGFVNDTDYTGAFSVVDIAGVIKDPTDVETCTATINPIRTTQVQGFLAKSDCFIASAAFGDTDGPAVQLLRRFRDEVLTRIPGGQGLVHAYYAWSPKAAEWLMEHPIFRVPVLTLLAPVLAFAWLSVHWALAMAAVVAGVFVAWGLRRRVWL